MENNKIVLFQEKQVRRVWHDKRLTDEWKNRGVKEGQEYLILTAEISKATFGMTPTEYRALKGLDKQNLRDHMTHIELIFSMLGEETTRQLAIRDNAQGFNQNSEAAIGGGNLAARARADFEKTTGNKVITAANFTELDKPEEKLGLKK